MNCLRCGTPAVRSYCPYHAPPALPLRRRRSTLDAAALRLALAEAVRDALKDKWGRSRGGPPRRAPGLADDPPCPEVTPPAGNDPPASPLPPLRDASSWRLVRPPSAGSTQPA